MTTSEEHLLRELPEGILCAENDIITFLNPAAQSFLPHLKVGQRLSDTFQTGSSDSAASNIFVSAAGEYSFTLSRYENNQMVILRPVDEGVLTRSQQDGALRQLRGFLGEMLAELGSRTDASRPDFVGEDFMKTFHRMFRLVANADAASLSDAEFPFHPTTIDLAGLCSRLCQNTAPLLAEAGVTLTFECKLPSFLIPGDSTLLQRSLLELIANAAKAATSDRSAGQCRVVVALRRAGQRALLSVASSGNSKYLASAFVSTPSDVIPRPTQGAGLGLALVCRTVGLHHGTVAADCNAELPRLILSLPAGPLDHGLSVRSPSAVTDSGLDPLLVALADVLPAKLFAQDPID